MFIVKRHHFRIEIKVQFAKMLEEMLFANKQYKCQYAKVRKTFNDRNVNKFIFTQLMISCDRDQKCVVFLLA